MKKFIVSLVLGSILLSGCTTGNNIPTAGAEVKTMNSSQSSSTQSPIPRGPSARCRDGTDSFSAHRSGTCSHHGGVAEWL